MPGRPARERTGASGVGARVRDARGAGESGRLGHGPGWLWPCPRRPGDVREAMSPRGVRPGRSTQGGATERPPLSHESVTRLASRDGERGKSTLPCVLGNRHDRVRAVEGAIAPSTQRASSRALFRGPRTDRRLTEARRSRHLPHGTQTGVTDQARTSQSDLRPDLCTQSHETLTSWASRRGHSQPGPR